MERFDEAVISAVTGHMNGDHADDNLLIARAFGCPNAVQSAMIDVDSVGGVWRVTDADGVRDLRVAWPSGAITERPQIRREVVYLYRNACFALGIEPREEHGSNAVTDAERVHAVPAEGAAATDSAKAPFSRILRESTWADHSDSEGAGFMERIMRGLAPLEDYAALSAQHYFMYEALESGLDRFADEPLLRELHPTGLSRSDALAADLRHLFGDDWRERIAALPAVERYADRIREVIDSGWFAGYVAHHYTRYLGDLSGGQMIAKRVARQHGLESTGAEFYAFPEIGDLVAFKERYRAAVDQLGADLDESQRSRMIDEVRLAYRCNTEAFVDLSRAQAASEQASA